VGHTELGPLGGDERHTLIARRGRTGAPCQPFGWWVSPARPPDPTGTPAIARTAAGPAFTVADSIQPFDVAPADMQ